MSQLRFCYVLPVHNDADLLPAQVESFCSHVATLDQDYEVVLAENGSVDNSARVAAGLAGDHHGVRVRSVSTTSAGLGHAYHMGIEHGLADGDLRDAWYVLSSAELPFGFSDLESFLDWHAQAAESPIAIGSKAHSESIIAVPWKRRLASKTYRFVRRGVGMRTRDSQGSLFVRADLARELSRKIMARDFFYSTELVFLAEQKGIDVTELPVVLRPALRASTVKFSRDVPRMLWHLTRLLREQGRIRK